MDLAVCTSRLVVKKIPYPWFTSEQGEHVDKKHVAACHVRLAVGMTIIRNLRIWTHFYFGEINVSWLCSAIQIGHLFASVYLQIMSWHALAQPTCGKLDWI